MFVRGRVLAVVVLVVAVLTPATAAAGVPASPDHRQTWVWQPHRPADLVALARRDAVTELLVWVAPGFTRDPAEVARLTRLARQARSAGVEVTALGGDRSWVLQPALAASWAHEVAGSGLFTALHVDVEPQQLPLWTTDRPRAARGLLAALDAVGAAGLPVAADIAAWLQTVRVDGGRLDDAVFRRVDAVTVMAYRDTAARVLAFARPAVTRAAAFGVPATIGVEIGPTTEPGTSMAGVTRDDLLAALATITRGANAAGWTAFAGTAVHDAEHLALL